MKVIVTGGAGFIGANLCRELVTRPQVDQIIAIDNLSTGSAENLRGTGVTLIEASILDRPVLEEIFDGADAVVHLAARPSVPRSLADPTATHDANATGTMYVLEAARHRSVHMITASSSSVYGAIAELPKHEDLATRPLSPYGASKLATETYSLAYATSFDLPVLALRFFNVFGPLQSAGHAYAAVVPTFIDAALTGRPLRIHGNGLQTRDFTFVGTVTRVLADAVVHRVTCPTPVNLAFGTCTSVLDLAGRLTSLIGVPLQVEYAAARPGDVRHSQADATRLRTLFPHVEPVPLEAGLQATVEWFRGLPQYAAQAAPASMASVEQAALVADGAERE